MISGRQIRSFSGHALRRGERGFTLIELVMVSAIMVTLSVIAIPLIQNASSYFKLQGAITATTGAIQSTRYLAISQGCQTDLVFTAATGSYQIQTTATGAGGCAGTFSNVCPATVAACPVPLAGTGTPVTLNTDITLVFKPGGSVSSPTFPGGGVTFNVIYNGRPPEVLTVSNYGSITVTP